MDTPEGELAAIKEVAESLPDLSFRVDIIVRSRDVLEKRSNLGIGSCAKPPKRGKSYMNELTAEWLEKGEQDFVSADILLHAGEFPIPDTACFHCQQFAEKYLKAFLQEHQIEFERRHDLMPRREYENLLG